MSVLGPLSSDFCPLSQPAALPLSSTNCFAFVSRQLPLRSTTTSRLCRPCRSSQSLHSDVSVQCFRVFYFLLPNFYFFCALCIHGNFAITFLSETSPKERKYGNVYQSSSVYRPRHPQRQGHDQARRRRDRRGRENGHQSHRFILDDGRVRRRALARRAR